MTEAITISLIVLIIAVTGSFGLGMLIQYSIGRNQRAKLESELAVKDTLIKTDEARIAEQEAALSTVRESLMSSFSELASESLAKTNKTFLQLAEQNFDKHQTQAKANLKER